MQRHERLVPPGGAIEEGSLLKAVMDDVCEKGSSRSSFCTGAMLSWYVRQGYYLYVPPCTKRWHWSQYEPSFP